MDLSVTDHLLTTTRSVRKRLDLERPVDPAVVQECLEIAIQAPSGSNRQGYHFMVVTDAEKRRQVASYYAQSYQVYYQEVQSRRKVWKAGDPRGERADQVLDSATYLAGVLHRVPVFIIPCIQGRLQDPSPAAQAGFYGSILPAAWSLMLALRSRGLGAAWTTLHLAYEREVAAVLGIPDSITQAALLPVAYYTGDDFRPAKRIPAAERTYWDEWGRLAQ